MQPTRTPLSLAIISLSTLMFATSATAITKTSTKTTAKPAKVTTKTTTKTTPKTTTKTTKTVKTAPESETTTTYVPVNLPEPTVTTISYPKVNTITFVGTDVMAEPIASIATPSVKISQAQFIPTVLVPKTTANNGNLDVSVVDDFIAYAMPMARHYPPVFPSNTVRYNVTQQLISLTNWMNNYAKDPNASYDVLLRAAKLNILGRNLNLGQEYVVNASTYVTHAMKLQDTAEANFLYGMMLSEGGGFDEGEKYLAKAAKMGFAEAYQSMAQSDLLNDKKAKAIQRLNDFKTQYPNDPYIDRQLAIVNSGKYYIWDLPAQR